MEPASTYFSLPLETREVEVIVVEKLFTPTFYDQALEELCQNVLVVKG